MPKIINKGQYIQLTSSDGINTHVTPLIAISYFDFKKELKDFIISETEVVVNGSLVAYEINGKRFSLHNTEEKIINFYGNAHYGQMPIHFEQYLIDKKLVKSIDFENFDDMDHILG